MGFTATINFQKFKKALNLLQTTKKCWKLLTGSLTEAVFAICDKNAMIMSINPMTHQCSCLQGSLSAHIKNRGVLLESESQRYTKQLLKGVKFLHSQNVIHRDIKGKLRKLPAGNKHMRVSLDYKTAKYRVMLKVNTDHGSHFIVPKQQDFTGILQRYEVKKSELSLKNV